VCGDHINSGHQCSLYLYLFRVAEFSDMRPTEWEDVPVEGEDVKVHGAEEVDHHLLLGYSWSRVDVYPVHANRG